jgi:DHA1 family putative efflux transporter-like MFS transporter/DHA1 family purine base/nucleoside efflux pump-like MFS transporter
MLIIAGVVIVPAVWSMGMASNIWQLAVLSIIVWFLGGVEITLINTLAGLFAEEDKRGKIFGILRLTVGLGMLIGGLSSGPIVDMWGYPTMFMIVAIFCVILPVAALFLKDKVVEKIPIDKQAPTKVGTGLTGAILLLAITFLVAQVPRFTGAMGRSLIMDQKDFSTGAISSTAALEGAISLPLYLLLGWLSDNVGRKRLIGLCFFIYSMGMLLLAFSVSLWQFYIFSVLRAVMVVSNSVGMAYAADLVPQKSLGKGMSLFQAAFCISGIVGYSITGYAFQNFGMTLSVGLFAILPIIAIILLIPIREQRLPNKIAGG